MSQPVHQAPLKAQDWRLLSVWVLFLAALRAASDREVDAFWMVREGLALLQGSPLVHPDVWSWAPVDRHFVPTSPLWQFALAQSWKWAGLHGVFLVSFTSIALALTLIAVLSRAIGAGPELTVGILITVSIVCGPLFVARASVELKSKELGYELTDPASITRVVDRVKTLENKGWSFEAADASFELLVLKHGLEKTVRFFDIESWRVIVEQREDGTVATEATVKLRAQGERIIATAEGNGPVNALDAALRSAVTQQYPELADIDLVDYKVRILADAQGTGATTRVLVGSRNGENEWTTVGVHENVIAASWIALEDALTFGLLHTESAGR